MQVSPPLFKCQALDGLIRFLNLDSISHVSREHDEQPPAYWVFLADGVGFRVDLVEGDRLLDAWQEFLKAKHLVTALGLGEVIPFGD